MQSRYERHLAAILAADVAGYSRLMGLDEEGTLAELNAHRQALIDPKIAEHRGRIVKTTGDGALIEFASVVDAVRCAIEVQRGMIERNSGIPQEKRIEFRIGINVGDIIVDGGDIFGDGVNVAARLEGIAKPGGICLSRAAHDQVRGRFQIAFRDLGELRLKNIAAPVRAFSIDLTRPPRKTDPPSHTALRRVHLALERLSMLLSLAARHWRNNLAPAVSTHVPATPAKLDAPRSSIVVLPFANLSGDPQQAYLADVITEGLTTALARIPGTFVIARSTAFTYKNKPVNVRQLGEELGVRYVLEGSEQHGGEKVRVNAQLIDAETNAHLWADQFDAERSDPLQMQDEIVTRIASVMHLELAKVEASRVVRDHRGTTDAEDFGLRCQAATWNAVTVGWQTAYGLCETALQIDDRDVFATAVMSTKYSGQVLSSQSVDRQSDLQKADELAARALALEPNHYLAHFAKAWVLMGQMRSQDAVAEGERCLALNPNFITAYFVLGTSYNFLGQPDRTLELADKAIRLSPRDPFLQYIYHVKGWALFMKEQDAQAIEWLRRAQGPDVFTDLILAAAFALERDQAEARKALQRYLARPGVTSRSIAQLEAQQLSISQNLKWVAYNERLFEGLRKAGMQEQ